VTLLDDRQQPVVEASWNALDELVKSIDKEEMDALVVPLRRTIEGTGAPGRHVPGFSLPKGISPVLPIIFAGLTTGSNEQRENAAYAISDLVERTEENALKPFTTQLTGPLIRVITQSTSYPAGVKSAILTALTMMLSKIPTFIKPFFPQLQRTFVKSLLDPSLAVRNKAGLALGVLMRSQPRVDPIITELVGLVRGQVEEDIAVAASVAVGIAEVVKSAGEGLSENSTSLLVELIAESFGKTADGNVSSFCVGLHIY
jgi:HEAT repeat protein